MWSAGTAEAIEASVRKILIEVAALSGKLDLIGMVGHRDGTGQLISEAAALDLERGFRAEIRGEPPRLWRRNGISSACCILREKGLKVASLHSRFQIRCNSLSPSCDRRSANWSQGANSQT